MIEGIPYGDYYLLGRLNQGGMAEVFLGKSCDPAEPEDRLLAIKRLLPNYSVDPEIVKMFADEARIAKRLHHPNICEVVDEGQEANQLFMAMEFIHGKDLKVVQHRVQKAGEAIPYRLIAFILSRIADALEYAHSRKGARGEPENIVHRDVSPQNILISYDGVPKLIDFGIAKAKNRVAETRVGVVKGKFGYMAPEQVSGGNVDGRSDIFALGVVLYELLCGQGPFKAANEISTLRKITSGDYQPVHVVNADVPRQLADMTERALALDPTRRYQRSADMSADLMRYVRDGKQAVDEGVLAAYMRKLFRDDYVRELARVKQYRAASVPQREPTNTDTRPGPTPPPLMPEGRTEIAPTFMLAAGFNLEDGDTAENLRPPRRRERDDDLFDYRPFPEDEVTPDAPVGASEANRFDEPTDSTDVPLSIGPPLLEERTSVMPPSVAVPRTPLPRRNSEIQQTQPESITAVPDDTDVNNKPTDERTDEKAVPAGFTNEITKEEFIPNQTNLGLVEKRRPSNLDEVLNAIEAKRPQLNETKPVPLSSAAGAYDMAVDTPSDPSARLFGEADAPPPSVAEKEPAPVPALRERDEDLAQFAANLVKRDGESESIQKHVPIISRGEALALVVAAMLGMGIVGVCYLYALKAPLPDSPIIEDINARLGR